MFLGPFSVHKRAILRPAYFFILLFTLFGLHFSKLRSPFSFYPFGLRPFLVPFWASKTYVTRVNPKTVVATKFSFSTIIFFLKWVRSLYPFWHPKRMLQVLTQKWWLQRNFNPSNYFFPQMSSFFVPFWAPKTCVTSVGPKTVVLRIATIS